jgi:large conductance mechanosensitive channel
MGFVQDFKDFAFKGNIVDMAVGVVIGTATAAIVKSFIDNIVAPLIAFLVKVPDLSEWKLSLGEATVEKQGVRVVENIYLSYGRFIQNMLDFLILAFAVFVAIRVMSQFMKKAKASAEPSAEVKLLTQIRDALTKQ